jgi:YHS domain-containing protein
VRAVQFALLIVIVVLLVLPFAMRRLPSRPRIVVPDELVKDPVCQTYVLRSRAITASSASGPPFFCSAECARRYSGGARG